MVTDGLGTDFYFMRHGLTASNAADRIAGFTDEPLTAEGLAEAERQARKLEGIALGSLWVSPLLRARQTAEAVLRWTDAPLHVVEDLKERNWGILEGEPRSRLRRDEKPEGGEGPDEFRERTRTGLARITGPSPTLVVAHSGTAREIHALLGIAFERPGNCAILHFRRTGDRHWTATKL